MRACMRAIAKAGNGVVDLLLFSDKSICHIQLYYHPDTNEVSTETVNRFKLFDDFIWDCALVNDKQHLVVGYAHNRVEVYRIEQDGGPLHLVGDVVCSPQCVLYC